MPLLRSLAGLAVALSCLVAASPAAAQCQHLVDCPPASPVYDGTEILSGDQDGTTHRFSVRDLQANIGATGVGITRAQIPATIIGGGKTIRVSGFRAAGDLGADATYSSVGATSGGLEAIQDASGTWFNLVLATTANPGFWGAYADNGAHTIAAADLTANPQWRGGYVAGQTWDYVATQEAILAAFAATSTPGVIHWNSVIGNNALNKRLFVPNGTYGIDAQLLMIASGVQIDFASVQARWNWQGPFTTSMLLTNSISYGQIDNIALVSSQVPTTGGVYPAPLWSMDYTGSPAGLRTQQLIINNALISTSIQGRGVSISPSGGGAQGSTIMFNNPEFVGQASDYGLRLGGGNVVAVEVRLGDFQGYQGDAISDASGGVFVRGTTFENQGIGLGLNITPVTNQVVNGTGDVHAYGGVGNSLVDKLQDVRSEADAAFLCEASTYCTADAVRVVGADQLSWFASFPYLRGALVSGGTKAHTFVVVDDSGIAGWPLLTGGTACVPVDGGASYTVNQWAGFTLQRRFSNGFTERHVIASNTATAITLVGGDCLGSAPGAGDVYHIGGSTAGSAPSFDTATGGHFTPANGYGVGQGVATTAGSNVVTVGSFAIALMHVGDYIVIPYADLIGPSIAGGSSFTQQYVAPLIAKITAVTLVSPFTVTINKNAALSVGDETSGRGGAIWGPPLADGQISYIDADFNAFQGIMSLTSSANNVGRTYKLGTVSQYASLRADWNRGDTGTPQFNQNSDIESYNQVYGATQTVAYNLQSVSGATDLTQPLRNSNALLMTPVAAATLNAPAPTVGAAATINFEIVGIGVAETVTFGTNFKGAGPLTTDGVTGSLYNIGFVSDGTNWIEQSRSGANRGAAPPIPFSQLTGTIATGQVSGAYTGISKVGAQAYVSFTPTTVTGLATADPSPADGDSAYVTDATIGSCVLNTAIVGASTVHCRVHYDSSSSSWKAG